MTRWLKRSGGGLVLVAVLAATAASLSGQGRIAADGQNPAILALREQAAVYNNWLRNRLDRILPELMRQEGIDMWLVICRENNEDPVFFSLVPFTSLYASRTSMLVFFDRGAAGVERLTVSRAGFGDLYTSVWEPEKIDQWARLAHIISGKGKFRGFWLASRPYIALLFMSGVGIMVWAPSG